MTFLKKIIVAILILESRLILAKYRPFIIAVTGSVGKTSTKDAIYAVLKNNSRYVRKSEKSMNSEIGLPLTIIGVPNAWRDIGAWLRNIGAGLSLILKKNDYPDTLILEVGADHPGDIKKIVKWLRPSIAVITRVSRTPVHVEFFDSPEQVFEEKAALVRGMRKNGMAILYGDDDKLLSLGNEILAEGRSVVTFGINENNNVRVFDYRNISALTDGMTFKISLNEQINDIVIKKVIGRTYMLPLGAASAVGKVIGMNNADIVRGLSEYEPPKGRMNVLSGINSTVLIDDTYNSSPDAVMAALETLKELNASGGRKIAVLGDMMELGKYSAEEHRKIGQAVVGIADLLITVGQRSKATAEEAVISGMNSSDVHMFNASEETVIFLKNIIKNGDVILVKGSQSVRMEKIVKALLIEPERATELLVRQEKEWVNKV